MCSKEVTPNDKMFQIFAEILKKGKMEFFTLTLIVCSRLQWEKHCEIEKLSRTTGFDVASKELYK